MNFGESSGESSSSGRENGAASSEPDRPHKKARFPWQIKGKHHLKNQTDEPDISDFLLPSPEVELEYTPPTESGTPPPELLTLLPESVSPPPDFFDTIWEDEVIPKARNRMVWHGSRPKHLPATNLPLETVISLAESMLMRSDLEVSFTNASNELKLLLERELLSPGPSNPVIVARNKRKAKRQEEMVISQWQAAQTVRGCFDNTINRVLESWMTDTAPPEERNLALDYARIRNELPDDDDVENEAILMAINAHGLRNMTTTAGCPPFAYTEALASTIASDIPICESSDSSICSDDYNIYVQKEREKGTWLSSDDENNDSARQGQSDQSKDRYVPWKREKRRAAKDDGEYEFLNTAVIQAIKSKGLMAAGTYFG